MKQKQLSLLLATILAASCVLSGCGDNEAESSNAKGSSAVQESSVSSEKTETVEEEPKEPVTICYYYLNDVGEQRDTGLVEERLNEILSNMEGYEHITMDLVPCSDYLQTFTLAQASGAQIDLVSLYQLDEMALVDNGDLLPLDELLAEHPDIIAEVPDWVMEFGKINGTQYYIPTYQQATNGHFIYFPEEYLKATGYSKDEIRDIFQKGTMEEKLIWIEEYCYAVREATGSDTKWIRETFPKDLFWNMSYATGDYTDVFVREGGDGPEYWPLTEEYKLLLEYMAKWYKDGLVHPDATTYKAADFYGNNFLNEESLVLNHTRGVHTEEMMESNLTDQVSIAVVQTKDHHYIPEVYAAKGNAIYADCEHPEEAMMIIELLMNSKGEEFYNTLVWGLEGTHYKWIDKDSKRIETLEYSGSKGNSSSSYFAIKWNTGNTFNCWKNQSQKDGFNEHVIANVHEGADTVVSPLMGITWDTSPVTDQIAQCNAVTKEYSWTSLITAEDWEARYNEYVEKLKAAGVQDILDCVSDLYEAHMNSK